MKDMYKVTSLSLRQGEESPVPVLEGRANDRTYWFCPLPLGLPADYMIAPAHVVDAPEILESPDLNVAMGLIVAFMNCEVVAWKDFSPRDVRVSKSTLDCLAARGWLLEKEFVTFSVTVGLVHTLYLAKLVKALKSPPAQQSA
jgi:hypothetical protein